jgi:hypothetical protein
VSTCARRAAAIASKSETAPGIRRWARWPCYAAPTGSQIGALCRGMHGAHGETTVRRIQGVLSLAKKHGAASVEEACAAALEVGICDYRFVRRYLERHPQMPLSLRQVDPLIRQLTLYRDFIENKTKENEHELD